MAKKRTATTPAPRPAALPKKLSAFVPRSDLRVVKGYETLYTINSDDEASRARQALEFLTAKIKAIKGNERLNKLIRKTKEAYDEARGIQKDALAIYVPHEKAIRDELGRFQTARERARLAAAPKLTAKLTKQLTAAAQPVEVEIGDDTFEFEPVAVDVGTAVTLQAPDIGAGQRKFWRVALVDPEKPTTKDGEPIVNPDAGIRAIAAAIVAGTVAPNVLQINDAVVDGLVDTLEGNLQIPGLHPYFVMRPVIGGR